MKHVANRSNANARIPVLFSSVVQYEYRCCQMANFDSYQLGKSSSHQTLTL